MQTKQETNMASKAAGFAGQELRKPDSQGRIAIGKENADETYAVEKQASGDILLRPVVVIHKQEAWLFKNQDALASVKRGLEDAAAGRTHDLGSFADEPEQDCEDD
jgi:hypothetical protein